MPIKLIWLTALLCCAAPAGGDVVVVANRCPKMVQARVTPAGEPGYPLLLVSGQVMPLFSDKPLSIAYQTSQRVAGFRMEPNSAYYFGPDKQGYSLSQIGFQPSKAKVPSRKLPGAGVTTPAGVIKVALYVDEDERSRRDQWEPKLRGRIEKASQILLAHSGMTLRITRVGKWQTDNRIKEFNQSLKEFEQTVQPPPGGVAIGFTSQYHVLRGRVHLGGTRGALHTHILLREWSQHISEQERLELLLHELGHFLGAAHSPEADSVMRAVVGDRKSRRKGFAIRYDPINTLVMSMVGEEVRRRGIRRFDQLTPATRQRLNAIYRTLSKISPQDASTARFAAVTEDRNSLSEAQITKILLNAISNFGRQNAALPDHPRLSGDALTEQVVQRAAQAALPMKVNVRKPLLYALAIALDDSGTLRSLPGTGSLVRDVDPPGGLAERNAWFGSATLLGRRDLMKHFVVSAALVASVGAEKSEALGLAKEVLDSNRKSGFSFRDLAADRAGVRFGQRLLSGQTTPVQLADQFTTEAFLPDVHDLPEGLSAKAFAERYGDTYDQRFKDRVAEIDQRISQLTGYQQP